ncbi:CPBP family intramembrane metalloprotease [Halorubrum gandharaense]
MSGYVTLPDNGIGRIGSSIVVIFAALIVASLFATSLTALGVELGLFSADSTAERVTSTILQFVGFLLAAVGYLAVTNEWEILGIDTPSLRDVGLIAGSAVVLLALQYGLLFVLSQIGLSTGQNQATVPTGDPVVYYLALIVVSILVVGPAEEVLFRGVVQGGLRRAYSAWPAILIASALFGLVHVFAVSGTLGEQLAYAGVVGVLGALLGLLYEYTDNVLVPGLAHGFYNAAIYVTLLYGVL